MPKRSTKILTEHKDSQGEEAQVEAPTEAEEATTTTTIAEGEYPEDTVVEEANEAEVATQVVVETTEVEEDTEVES